MSNAMWTKRCGDKCAEDDEDDVKSATTQYDNIINGLTDRVAINPE